MKWTVFEAPRCRFSDIVRWIDISWDLAELWCFEHLRPVRLGPVNLAEKLT